MTAKDKEDILAIITVFAVLVLFSMLVGTV